MNKPCWVTAIRGNDLYFPEEFGKLRGFRFHRTPAPYGIHAVRVQFPSWATAQKAVHALRRGDASLWDAAVWEPIRANYEFHRRVFG